MDDELKKMLERITGLLDDIKSNTESCDVGGIENDTIEIRKEVKQIRSYLGKKGRSQKSRR
jgi:hypothetical protein